MAMPTSADASAGASFTPSPTIATEPNLPPQLVDRRHLVFGQQLGPHLVHAELAGNRLRGGLAVAGQHHDRLDALTPQQLERVAPASRGRSATAMMPTASPLRATSTGRPALCAPTASSRAWTAGEHRRALLEQPVVAEHDAAPSTRPSAPRPASAVTSVPDGTPIAGRVAHIEQSRCAIGCSDRCSTAAASATTDAGAHAVERHDLDHLGRAARQRAGLVERDAADAAARSRCAPPLMSTPFRAAPASAATIDTGVEMTSAQGHDTTSSTSAR